MTFRSIISGITHWKFIIFHSERVDCHVLQRSLSPWWNDVSVHSDGAGKEELTLLQTICVSMGRQTAGQVATNAQGNRWPWNQDPGLILTTQQVTVQANSCAKLWCMYTLQLSNWAGQLDETKCMNILQLVNDIKVILGAKYKYVV